MVSNKFDLSGKTILITGASSGIGKQCAIDIAHQVGNCFITGRDHKRLEETFNALPKGNHELFSADLTDDTKIDELIEMCPKLDGVVFSAGITENRPIKFIDKNYYKSIMDINFRAPVLLTSKLLRKKKINKVASLVFISSISSSFPAFGTAIYASSKSALETFSKNLAIELSSKNIRSNCVAPAFVETKMLSGVRNQISDETLEKLNRFMPLGFGSSEDVSNTILYLLSDKSSWITGQEIKLGSI